MERNKFTSLNNFVLTGMFFRDNQLMKSAGIRGNNLFSNI